MKFPKAMRNKEVSVPASETCFVNTWSVPAKLVLFGEWAVTEGGTGVAVSLAKRFFWTTASFEPKNYLEIHDLSFRKKFSSKDSLVDSDFSLLAKLYKSGDSFFSGSHELQREWEINEGLGSSSALTLLFATAHLNQHQKNPLQHPGDLWNLARNWVRITQSPRASGIDLATQLWGGTVVLRDLFPVLDTSSTALSNQVTKPNEIMLIHTGKKQSTAKELATRTPDFSLLQDLSNSAERFVQSRKWIDEMRVHHKLLSAMGVVPEWLLHLKKSWENRFGIRALKTTGSGGGDAVLVWCELESQSAFRQELAQLGFWEQLASWNAQGLVLEKT